MKYKDMVAAAHRYAAANKSDPFALKRALSHIACGVAGMRIDEGGHRVPATYDAKAVQTERGVTEYVDQKVV